jgi:hypothetical protein
VLLGVSVILLIIAISMRRWFVRSPMMMSENSSKVLLSVASSPACDGTSASHFRAFVGLLHFEAEFCDAAGRAFSTAVCPLQPPASGCTVKSVQNDLLSTIRSSLLQVAKEDEKTRPLENEVSSFMSALAAAFSLCLITIVVLLGSMVRVGYLMVAMHRNPYAYRPAFNSSIGLLLFAMTLVVTSSIVVIFPVPRGLYEMRTRDGRELHINANGYLQRSDSYVLLMVSAVLIFAAILPILWVARRRGKFRKGYFACACSVIVANFLCFAFWFVYFIVIVSLSFSS